MNPLEEHAHLFANGKFKMQVNIYPESKQRATGTITCYSFPGACGIGALKVDSLGWVAVKKDGRNPKLIARPIADMSIPEAHRAIKLLDYDASADEYRQLSSAHNNLDQALYLLSIGVYPFSQDHFGDTVIDSRTLKTTA